MAEPNARQAPPHMCRMEHEEIWHRDAGPDERCPLCRVLDDLDALIVAAPDAAARLGLVARHPDAH